MTTIGEEGSNALDAASDLLDLLRLSHSALHRLEREVHGDCFEAADILSKKILDLRDEAERLNQKLQQYVKEMENESYGS